MRLKIVKGKNTGTTFDLDGELFVGRDAGNDIVVPDHTASRHHVKIAVVNGRVLVRDLGSNNGTFVNGARVAEAIMKEDDKLLIGSTLFVLEGLAETLRPETACREDRTVVSSVAQQPGKKGRAPGAQAEVRFIGNSTPFKKAIETALATASTSSPALLRGESGTGKELFARFIHATSERRDGPFIALNCAAFPETLLESELFGYAKGAFTGADAARPGKFELAHGGTLFLDEVADCSLALQAKLLRAVETKEFFPVGASKTKRVDVRVLAATNKDLEKAVEEKAFRQDLYYRLNVVAIVLPPLRDRADDVPFLAYQFLQDSNAEAKKAAKGISSDALDALKRHNWPGNVRELANVIERAVVLCPHECIGLDDLPEEIRAASVSERFPGSRTGSGDEIRAVSVGERSCAPGVGRIEADIPLMNFSEAERLLIIKALKHTGGRKGEAANLLGISWPTLNKKIREYGIGQ